MKTRIFTIAVAAIALLGLSSCNKWFDETESTSTLTDATIWQEESTVDLYVNGFYTYISKYGPFGTSQFGGSLTESLTDTFKYGSSALGHKAGHPNNYVCNPDAITTGGCLYGIWGDAYTQIRRINQFLDSIEKFSKFSDEKNTTWEAQARFFRAFIYFQLAKRHPEGVILRKDLNMTNDAPRSSADEMWDFIETDLDFAAANLPEAWNSLNYGRVTKYAALAFKSRAMLYAERWESAYNAAYEVIQSGKFELMDDYSQSWKGSNKESILEFRYSKNGPYHTFDRDNVPMCDGYSQGATGTPTQEMVESYEKADGTEYDWSGYHTGSKTSRPDYESLEPRFQATVIYNGCTWKGQKMDCSFNGENGTFMEYGSAPYAYNLTTTGYFLRKLMDESLTDMRGIYSSQTWVEIRYAEVLLNIAEAAYRAGKPAAEYQSYMNQVRHRVGLPDNKEAGNTWFAGYRRERKVELSYEGHLFWDMRRWRLAAIEYSNYRVHGFMIKGSSFNYIPCDLSDRQFLTKLYCLPIPDDELSNNKLIEQYDDWK